jgi:hypothetical protein
LSKCPPRVVTGVHIAPRKPRACMLKHAFHWGIASNRSGPSRPSTGQAPAVTPCNRGVAWHSPLPANSVPTSSRMCCESSTASYPAVQSCMHLPDLSSPTLAASPVSAYRLSQRRNPLCNPSSSTSHSKALVAGRPPALAAARHPPSSCCPCQPAPSAVLASACPVCSLSQQQLQKLGRQLAFNTASCR